MIKFNGGRGAVICDKCRVIFVDDFFYRSVEVRKKYEDMEKSGGTYKHLCDKCDKKVNK